MCGERARCRWQTSASQPRRQAARSSTPGHYRSQWISAISRDITRAAALRDRQPASDMQCRRRLQRGRCLRAVPSVPSSSVRRAACRHRVALLLHGQRLLHDALLLQSRARMGCAQKRGGQGVSQTVRCCSSAARRQAVGGPSHNTHQVFPRQALHVVGALQHAQARVLRCLLRVQGGRRRGGREALIALSARISAAARHRAAWACTCARVRTRHSVKLSQKR